MPLPILDARVLEGGTEKELKAFGETLLANLAENGAVKLVNTPIPDGEISSAFKSVRGMQSYNLHQLTEAAVQRVLSFAAGAQSANSQ